MNGRTPTSTPEQTAVAVAAATAAVAAAGTGGAVSGLLQHFCQSVATGSLQTQRGAPRSCALAVQLAPAASYRPPAPPARARHRQRGHSAPAPPHTLNRALSRARHRHSGRRRGGPGALPSLQPWTPRRQQTVFAPREPRAGGRAGCRDGAEAAAQHARAADGQQGGHVVATLRLCRPVVCPLCCRALRTLSRTRDDGWTGAHHVFQLASKGRNVSQQLVAVALMRRGVAAVAPAGPPYCQRCSEIFRDHIIRQISNSAGCSRERPCRDCHTILQHFKTPLEQVWRLIQEKCREKARPKACPRPANRMEIELARPAACSAPSSKPCPLHGATHGACRGALSQLQEAHTGAF